MKLVRIATTYWTCGNLSPKENLKRACEMAELAGQEKADILCLPELFSAEPSWTKPEPVPGPTTRALAAKARKHKMHIVCPVLQREGDLTYNSAVLLDRRGQVAGVYHKFVPTIGELEKGIAPGWDVPVFRTDVGRVGMAICFDLNFWDVAERLRFAVRRSSSGPAPSRAARCWPSGRGTAGRTWSPPRTARTPASLT